MVPPPWMVCPPSRGLVSPCLPVLGGVSAFPRSCSPLSPISLLVSLCWMVCPPSRGFVSLVSQLVSQLVFLLVSQLVSQLVFLLVSLCGGWSDFAFFSNSVLLGVGFLKVSALVLDGVSAFPRSCLLSCFPACLSSCFPLWRVVSFCIFFSNSVRLGVLNAFSCHVFDPVPQKHVLNPPTVWGLRWCNIFYLCPAWRERFWSKHMQTCDMNSSCYTFRETKRCFRVGSSVSVRGWAAGQHNSGNFVWEVQAVSLRGSGGGSNRERLLMMFEF